MTSPWLALAAAPAALGFAMFFNVRRRALGPIALLAIIGKLISISLVNAGQSPPVGALAGALFIGAVAYTYGPLSGEASPVYAFASVIPLVPGSYMFKTLEALMQLSLTPDISQQAAADYLVKAGVNGLTAASTILALTIGAITPMLLLPRMRTPED